MAINLINPSPRLGDPFQIVSPSGVGLSFTNRSGGTISRGQVAPIDLASTNSGFQDLCAMNATSGKYPVVIALADVGNGVTSDKFAPMGLVKAIITNGIVKGACLQPGTANTTGGNVLVAASTASGNFPACGIATETGDGTNPTGVVFQGVYRGPLGGAVSANGLY